MQSTAMCTWHVHSTQVVARDGLLVGSASGAEAILVYDIIGLLHFDIIFRLVYKVN
jgi:hypothetical protein